MSQLLLPRSTNEQKAEHLSCLGGLPWVRSADTSLTDTSLRFPLSTEAASPAQPIVLLAHPLPGGEGLLGLLW